MCTATHTTHTAPYRSKPVHTSPRRRGSAKPNSTSTAAVATNERSGYGSQPPSPNSPTMIATTASAGAASSATPRHERITSACVTPASASSAPATGLQAAQRAASAHTSPARHVISLARHALHPARASPAPAADTTELRVEGAPSIPIAAHTGASARLTPSANVTRPLHTSPSAATANHAAPHRATRAPYTHPRIRSNSAADASTASAPTARTPRSDPSGANSRL